MPWLEHLKEGDRVLYNPPASAKHAPYIVTVTAPWKPSSRIIGAVDGTGQRHTWWLNADGRDPGTGWPYLIAITESEQTALDLRLQKIEQQLERIVTRLESIVKEIDGTPLVYRANDVPIILDSNLKDVRTPVEEHKPETALNRRIIRD